MLINYVSKCVYFQEYSGSTANILTAVFCAILFPDKFEFTLYILLSMGCLFTGIYLYESKKVQTTSSTVPKEAKDNSDQK